jgi:predicted PhzF superfamily epimerase YddE/YHI9
MKIPVYQVDAFTDELFRGNPAAVCLPEEWPADELLLSVAAENNLSETAFCLGGGGEYELRWFSPTQEIDLCGHATLAASFVLCEVLGKEPGPLYFHTASGMLRAERAGTRYSLFFPPKEPAECRPPPELLEGLDPSPETVLRAGNDYLAVYREEAGIRSVQAGMEALAKLPGAVIVTAPAAAEGLDFVSRVFAPAEGIPEDPVTGSAHCVLVPYWSGRLGRDSFRAAQLSRRGGRLECRRAGDAIEISGQAVLYMEGTIRISL